MPSKPKPEIVTAVTTLIKEGRASTVREACAMIGWPEKRYPEVKRWLSSEKISVEALKREAPAPAKEGPIKTSADLPRMPPHRPAARRRLLRAAVVDIETLDFDAVAYAGVMTCACVLPLDSDDIITVSLELEDHADDRRILVELFRAMWDYDILIWQNGAAFDANWFNTKRIYYGMPDLRSWIYFDTYQIAKVVALAAGGKSLGNLIDFFGLTAEKTAIRKGSRSFARSWIPEEFNAMIANDRYHCQQDVLGQRELFDAIFPYAMSLRDNPFKMTKWKTGLPSFDAWESGWKIAQEELKQQREAAR